MFGSRSEIKLRCQPCGRLPQQTVERDHRNDDVEDQNGGGANAGSGVRLQDTYRKEDSALAAPSAVADLLVSWHIQEIVLPQQVTQEVAVFDPLDESQVDLSGIVNAK